jgi:hypothetical protein
MYARRPNAQFTESEGDIMNALTIVTSPLNGIQERDVLHFRIPRRIFLTQPSLFDGCPILAAALWLRPRSCDQQE